MYRTERRLREEVTPSLIRNTKGNPLYYLLWASSNERGAPIANDLLP